MGVLNFRKYARVEVDIPVQVQMRGAPKPGRTHLSNLSEEGASLISDIALPIATSMEFDIPLPQGEAPAHVRADVLWSRQVNEEGRNLYAHGLLFNRIEVEDRSRLHAFIANSMSY